MFSSYPILPWDKDEEEVGGEDHAPSGVPLSDDDDDSGDDDRMEWGQSSASTHPMLVLPLYSLLPSDQQSRVSGCGSARRNTHPVRSLYRCLKLPLRA